MTCVAVLADVYGFLRWRQACCPDAPFTMALLAPYAHVDPQDYTPQAFRTSGQL